MDLTPYAGKKVELSITYVTDPAVQGRMREIGLDPLKGGPEEHRRLIEAERAVYWPLIRQLGLSLD